MATEDEKPEGKLAFGEEPITSSREVQEAGHDGLDLDALAMQRMGKKQVLRVSSAYDYIYNNIYL